VQSLEGNLALIHGGPFANIAHGCNSIMATKTAMNLAEYTVTEAGFGSDLGAEKFMDIVCPNAKFQPHAVVLVVSIRSLKMHGETNARELTKPNLNALAKGIINLQMHVKNLQNFNIPVVVAINQFPTDTKKELDLLAKYCEENNLVCSFTTLFAKGSIAAIDLAKKVISASKHLHKLKQVYCINQPLKVKLHQLVTKCYHADGVVYSPLALQKLKTLNNTKTYVCMAKTPLTFSDDPKQTLLPPHYHIHIRDLLVANGANFIIALAGVIFRMPGLPAIPAAVNMRYE
jgi:formate--tetrahydrofolate ligase